MEEQISGKKYKYISFGIENNIWEKFIDYCESKCYSKSAVLRRLIVEWLKKEGVFVD